MAEQPSDEARLELTFNANEEIAAVIVPDKNEIIKKKTVVCWRKTSNEPSFIKGTNPLYMPLHYVLICPYGTPGWTINDAKKISMLTYYRQIILRCEALHILGRLLNEFCVDMYSAIENNRLGWIRHNQQKILRKSDLDDRNEEGRVFLPASFVGSFRHNQKLFADGLAIVSRLKNPTYFITFTCNPNWEGITERLLPGQNASDRPDIVAMVFKAKLQKFLHCLPKLLNGKKEVYKIHVVEFQARGLPHTHVLVKMENEPQTGADIDKVISAELPTEPELLQKVLKHMMHSHYPERCYRTKAEKDSKKCHYTYPKPLNGETYLDEAGYPHYRRRQENDRNVVPYNPELLKLFDCHINVEFASSVTLIMYLYKYIYKGHDQAQGCLSKDEIKQFIAGRLLTASEATWRIFGYELTRRRPAVTNFPVHLQNQNYVIYDSSISSSKEMAVDRISKLERYFARPYGE